MSAEYHQHQKDADSAIALMGAIFILAFWGVPASILLWWFW